MGVKAETSLQKRIQDLIIKEGGYVNKNWGSMISKKGIGDLTACYKGFYLAIEVKVDDNEPTLAQGIHCRKVWYAGGIAMIAWNSNDVLAILNHIKYCIAQKYPMEETRNEMKSFMAKYDIDDGTRW